VSDRGIDQRFRRIEAQSRVPIPMDELLWIGYPAPSIPVGKLDGELVSVYPGMRQSTIWSS
jgi:hypothetical protein